MAYKLTHPDSQQTIEREADQVGMYQTQGWETKPGAKVPASPNPATTATSKE
jgi:hypothetical protein